MSVALFAVAFFACPGSASAAVKLDVVATCTGNMLKGTITVTGMSAGSVITVQAQAQTSGWSNVGAPASVTVVAGRTSYPVSLDVAGAPGAKFFRIVSDAGSGNSATSNHVRASSCGPPVQVPEVPAPLVIPVTMLLTAGVVEALRRRRLARVGA